MKKKSRKNTFINEKSSKMKKKLKSEKSSKMKKVQTI